jgi:hypothetical protein
MWKRANPFADWIRNAWVVGGINAAIPVSAAMIVVLLRELGKRHLAGGRCENKAERLLHGKIGVW